VFVEQLTGTLITIAKDVKIQVDFNPAQVGAYRLLGYENRMLRAEDFADDAKDAGEIGAGHTVTAFYEIIPAGAELPPSTVEPSKYQEPGELTSQSAGNEMLTVRLRYKLPDGEKSIAMDVPFENQTTEFAEASQDFRFAASVAEFGLLLRDSEFRGSASLQDVLQTATASIGDDPHGYRREFLELVKLAVGLP
jgi:Ca-activated chloride channel family protein